MSKYLYLDQNGLSNLSKDSYKKLREKFLSLTTKGKLKLCIAHPHCIETSKAADTHPKNTRSKIIKLADSSS